MIATVTLAALKHRMTNADRRYGSFTSSHEFLGVALEEFAEMTDAVRANDLVKSRDEAIDLAAACLRFADQSVTEKSLRERSVK